MRFLKYSKLKKVVQLLINLNKELYKIEEYDVNKDSPHYEIYFIKNGDSRFMMGDDNIEKFQNGLDHIRKKEVSL